MIDNKLCGDWQGLPKCPEMETELYVKYAQQFPDSPKAAEALYNAAYRQGTLVTMYTVEEEPQESATAAAAQRTQASGAATEGKVSAIGLCQRARPASLTSVQQDIAIYGNDRD